MKPGRKHIQFALFTSETEDGPVARFTIRRAKFDEIARSGFDEIERYCRQHGVAPEQGAAALMHFVRSLLLTSANGQVLDKSPVPALAVWYLKFRIDTGYVRAFKLNRVEQIRMYFLGEPHTTAPEWPKIKIAHGSYQDWASKTVTNFELPELERLDVLR